MIGERIYYFRKKLNLTQEQLSHAICSVPYLSKIENNKIDANEDILNLLCARLEISREEEIDSQFIIGQLKQCYHALSEKDFVTADECLNNIVEVKLEDNPELLTFFYIVKLKYALTLFDQNEAEKYYQLLEDMDIYAKKEVDYFLIRTKGLFEYLFGDLTRALLFWLRADELRERLYLIDNQLDYHLALVYSKVGNYILSILRGEKALKVFNDIANFEKVIDCYILLGINFNRIKEYEKAETYFLKALKVSNIHRDTTLAASVFHNLGYVYSNKGESEKALRHFHKSLELKENHSINTQLNTIYLLAKEYFHRKELESARKWIGEGLNHIDLAKKGYNFYRFNILSFQVAEQDTNEEFGDLLKEALDFFGKQGDYTNSSETSLLLAIFYKEKYQYKLAVKYYEKTLHFKNIIKKGIY